ncbi:hypothetical protein FSP39_016830 [Pinctada imbricata]|uniref:Uncharacterized protein n=1 Tax=Pinctada imbricata TaxID=66713 RepID=A0AA88XW12_PINIB|nr:hypothetical protein FSP39_016830 [Pinctada imbricata]
MKICTMLIKEYSDHVCDCETKVYDMLINLHRSLSPCLKAKKIQQHHDAEIRRQLLNATDTIVTSLLTNRVFLTALLSTDKGMQ